MRTSSSEKKPRATAGLVGEQEYEIPGVVGDANGLAALASSGCDPCVPM